MAQPIDVSQLLGNVQLTPGSIQAQRMQIYQQLANNPGVQLPIYQPQGFTPEEQAAQQAVTGGLESGQKDMAKQQEQIRQQTAAMNQATQAGAAAKQAEIDATQQRVQQIADTAQRSMDAFGADIMNPDSKVSRAAEMLNTVDQEVMDNAQKLRHAQTATLIDDPITALLSFVTVPALQRKHNALATESAAYQNVVDNSIAEAANATKVAVDAIPTMTTAEAAAKKELAAQLANVDVAQANIALARDETQYIFNKNKMLMDRLSIATQKGELKRSEATKKFNSQVEAARAAASNWESRMRYGLAALDFAEAVKDEQWTLGVLKDGARVNGIPEATIAGMTTDSIKRLPKDLKDRWFNQGVTGAMGPTPLEALNNVQKSPGAALPPKAVKTAQLLGEIYKQTQANVARDPAYNTASDKDKPKVFNSAFNEAIKAQFENSSSSDVLKAPNVGQVLSTNSVPGVSSDNKPVAVPLAKLHPATVNALNPLVKATQPVTDSQVAHTIASSLISRGGKPGAIAQELVNYFSNAVAIRNSGIDFSRYSLEADSNIIAASRKYKVRGPGGGILGGSSTYDLTNPAEAQRFVLSVQNEKNNVMYNAREAFFLNP